MPVVSYLDTCCLIMFISRNDTLRKDLGIGPVDIERKFHNPHPDFYVPMPALGEALSIAIERKHDSDELLMELKRLVERGIIH